MLTEVHLGENVLRKESSGLDCNGPIPKLLESDQAGGIYDVKNDGCPKSMNAPDFSGGHVMEESCGLELSSRLEDLSVSQKHPDLTCIGDLDLPKNVDEQDISEADCHEHLSAIDHHFAEKSPGSGNLFDLANINSDDLAYNVIRNHHSGAGLCDHFTPVEKLSAPEQFPAHLCSQNDCLSQHLDTNSVVDSGNGSSLLDLTSDAQNLSVSTELSEPSFAENYDLSDSMRGHHYSRSDSPLATLGAISIEDHSEQNQNGRTDPIDFDSDQTTMLPDVISPSQRRWSFRKTKSRQDAETVKCKRNGWRAGEVSFDLDLLQIMRRRRSCSGKRARALSWGLHSNLDLDEKPFRSRGQSSGKQVKNHPINHPQKVRRKRSHKTGDISVKFKVGVGVGVDVDSNLMKDGTNEGPLEVMGKTPELSEVEDPTKSMVSLAFQGNLKSMMHLSDDTTSDVGKNYVENITNLGSDLGTSPDSEVINLNPDTGLWGNSEEEFHNIPGSSDICLASDGTTCLVPKNSEKAQKQLFMGDCSAGDKPMESGTVDNDRQSAERGEIAVDVPYVINASTSTGFVFVAEKSSSTEQKSEGQSSSTVADIGSPCVPSADIGTEVTPRAGFNLESPVVEVPAKVHTHSKGHKILKGEKKDKARKSRSEIHVSANKGQRKSKKKVNQDKLAIKHKIKVKLRVGQTSSEAERQAGNSKLADLGESGIGKSSLTGDVSTFNVGFAEKSEKPRNAWVLCDDCQKWRRIPAILADRIEEGNCSWTCKDNVDKNFGNCSIPQEKSDAEINKELEISEASCDEGVGDATPNSNNLVENQSRVTQQSTWKLIKSNQFLHRRKQTQTIDEIMVCHCKLPSDGGMGCGDGCLNRMLNIECVQGTCPCGELCSNQQFQNRNYARLERFKCGKKGYGIQVLENISEGQFLIEYVGEVLDMHSYEARQRDYAMQGHKHFYFMTLNGSEVIDACAKGNLGRFINHSCDPNCRTEKWMVNGEVCVGLFALKNIKKGEELTFDYNYVRVFGAAAKKCVCGSSQCRGYIGGNPQNTEIVEDDSEDDYPEPVMVCKDGAVDESYPDMTLPLSTFDDIGAMNEEEPQKAVYVLNPLDFATRLQAVETGMGKVNNELKSIFHHEDAIEERLEPLNTNLSADVKGDTSEKTEDLFETVDRAKAVLKQDGISCETLITGKPEYYEAGEKMNRSRCSTLEENSATVVLNQMPTYVIDSKRKPKSGSGKGSIKFPVPKASRLVSSTKNEKFKSTPLNVHEVQETQGKNEPFCKPKKEIKVSTTGRFEAVQEKLNELLNPDGGISKRKDASKGYLKLLLLTAASGDSCNGEAIQSNRYLSMILGALLETKSRTVLVDIINKNGLQMLHNMLKRSRKEFNKIPILRKLLKVFEYLATREILTSEHINGGPTCPGVERLGQNLQGSL
ncbi:hypothetical protein LIER_30657 [Lithospermum erythrorhizon]|uniref:Histone-lysine N-methyltransferase ASHH2 n=1 Tax=Lithospermum erythrorhizon TaxID=34254 RepID=A0AAV3RSE8_LITER